MSTIFLSENANIILKNYLMEYGHTLKFIKDTGMVYPEVATHPDIYMCKLGITPEAPIYPAETETLSLGYKYPENVKYNAVCMGNYFIHNLRYTSPSLLDKIHQLKYKTIHVKQGYTKCNMVVVDKNSAITSDEGIYNSVCNYFKTQDPKKLSLSLENDKINLLLIRSGHIKLGNFPYGFLGGASGRVGNEIIFNGNLKAHPDYQRILSFITAKGLQVKYFEEYPLEDIGSIIEWRDQ